LSTLVSWPIPATVQGQPNYDQIHVYRADTEPGPYTLIATIPSGVANCPPAFVTSYSDATSGNGSDRFYNVRFFDSVANQETTLVPAAPEMSPVQTRLVYQLRTMLGPVMTVNPVTGQPLTDQELLLGINMAICAFNIYPPVTDFTADNFPHCYQVMLLYLAQLFSLMNMYLGFSINDFNYSDNGISLNIDRGTKINQAITNVQKIINDMLALIKLEFAFEGTSVGTLTLPVGIGGSISRGVSNILDVFNSMGR
jgi:hypothetical protein